MLWYFLINVTQKYTHTAGEWQGFTHFECVRLVFKNRKAISHSVLQYGMLLLLTHGYKLGECGTQTCVVVGGYFVGYVVGAFIFVVVIVGT